MSSRLVFASTILKWLYDELRWGSNMRASSLRMRGDIFGFLRYSSTPTVFNPLPYKIIRQIKFSHLLWKDVWLGPQSMQGASQSHPRSWDWQIAFTLSVYKHLIASKGAGWFVQHYPLGILHHLLKEFRRLVSFFIFKIQFSS